MSATASAAPRRSGLAFPQVPSDRVGSIHQVSAPSSMANTFQSRALPSQPTTLGDTLGLSTARGRASTVAGASFGNQELGPAHNHWVNPPRRRKGGLGAGSELEDGASEQHRFLDAQDIHMRTFFTPDQHHQGLQPQHLRAIKLWLEAWKELMAAYPLAVQHQGDSQSQRQLSSTTGPFTSNAVLPDMMHLLLLSMPAVSPDEGQGEEAAQSSQPGSNLGMSMMTQHAYARSLFAWYYHRDSTPSSKAASGESAASPGAASSTSGGSMPPGPAWNTFLPLMQRAVELASQLSSGVHRSNTSTSISSSPAGGSTPGINGNGSSNGRGPSTARGRGRPSSRKQQPPPLHQQQQQESNSHAGGSAANGTGARPAGADHGPEAVVRPALPASMLHNSMYRLLRMADFSVLRHGVTLSDCEPFAALAAWGVALAGAATAQVLSHVDPHQPSTTAQAIKILKDIAAGMAVLVDGHQQPVVLYPPAMGQVRSSPTSALAAAAQAASSRAMAAMGLPARVHALSQQLALLEQRRVARGAKGGAVSTYQKSVADQLEAALTALYAYTPGGTAGSPAAVPDAATHATGSASAEQGPTYTRLPPLAERYALIAADAWHRLGDHLHALGDAEAAAAAYTHALHAYEMFDRSTTDSYAEFNQGCDHQLFAAYWADIRQQGRDRALALPGAVFLQRDRIRCAISLAKTCAELAGAEQLLSSVDSGPPSNTISHAQLVTSLVNAYSTQCMQDELHTLMAIKKQQQQQQQRASPQPPQQTLSNVPGGSDDPSSQSPDPQPSSAPLSTGPTVTASDVAPSGPEGVTISGGVTSDGPWALLHAALMVPDMPLIPDQSNATTATSTSASPEKGSTFVKGWHLRLVCRTILQASYAAEQQLSQQRSSATARPRGLGRPRRKPASSYTPTTTTGVRSTSAGSTTAAPQPDAAAGATEAAPKPAAVPGSQEQAGDSAGATATQESQQQASPAATSGPLGPVATTTTTTASAPAHSPPSQRPLQVPDLLCVDGASVCDPVLAVSYANWYRRCRDIDGGNFNQRMGKLCQPLRSALKKLGEKAHLHTQHVQGSNQRLGQVPSGTPSSESDSPPAASQWHWEPSSSTSAAGSGSSSTQQQGSPSLAGSQQSAEHSRDASTPPVASKSDLAAAAAPKAGEFQRAWEEVVSKAARVVRLWQGRPVGAQLEPKHQAWLLVASVLAGEVPAAQQQRYSSGTQGPVSTAQSNFNTAGSDTSNNISSSTSNGSGEVAKQGENGTGAWAGMTGLAGSQPQGSGFLSGTWSGSDEEEDELLGWWARAESAHAAWSQADPPATRFTSRSRRRGGSGLTPQSRALLGRFGLSSASLNSATFSSGGVVAGHMPAGIPPPGPFPEAVPSFTVAAGAGAPPSQPGLPPSAMSDTPSESASGPLIATVVSEAALAAPPRFQSLGERALALGLTSCKESPLSIQAASVATLAFSWSHNNLPKLSAALAGSSQLDALLAVESLIAPATGPAGSAGGNSTGASEVATSSSSSSKAVGHSASSTPAPPSLPAAGATTSTSSSSSTDAGKQLSVAVQQKLVLGALSLAMQLKLLHAARAVGGTRSLQIMRRLIRAPLLPAVKLEIMATLRMSIRRAASAQQANITLRYMRAALKDLVGRANAAAAAESDAAPPQAAGAGAGARQGLSSAAQQALTSDQAGGTGGTSSASSSTTSSSGTHWSPNGANTAGASTDLPWLNGSQEAHTPADSTTTNGSTRSSTPGSTSTSTPSATEPLGLSCVLARPSLHDLLAAARLVIAACLTNPGACQSPGAEALQAALAVLPLVASNHSQEVVGFFTHTADGLLLQGPHPYLVLELAKALLDVGHPAALPISRRLAVHCATAKARIPDAVDALLAHAIRAAAAVQEPGRPKMPALTRPSHPTGSSSSTPGTNSATATSGSESGATPGATPPTSQVPQTSGGSRAPSPRGKQQSAAEDGLLAAKQALLYKLLDSLLAMILQVEQGSSTQAPTSAATQAGRPAGIDSVTPGAAPSSSTTTSSTASVFVSGTAGTAHHQAVPSSALTALSSILVPADRHWLAGLVAPKLATANTATGYQPMKRLVQVLIHGLWAAYSVTPDLLGPAPAPNSGPLASSSNSTTSLSSSCLKGPDKRSSPGLVSGLLASAAGHEAAARLRAAAADGDIKRVLLTGCGLKLQAQLLGGLATAPHSSAAVALAALEEVLRAEGEAKLEVEHRRRMQRAAGQPWPPYGSSDGTSGASGTSGSTSSTPPSSSAVPPSPWPPELPESEASKMRRATYGLHALHLLQELERYSLHSDTGAVTALPAVLVAAHRAAMAATTEAMAATHSSTGTSPGGATPATNNSSVDSKPAGLKQRAAFKLSPTLLGKVVLAYALEGGDVEGLTLPPSNSSISSSTSSTTPPLVAVPDAAGGTVSTSSTAEGSTPAGPPPETSTTSTRAIPAPMEPEALHWEAARLLQLHLLADVSSAAAKAAARSSNTDAGSALAPVHGGQSSQQHSSGSSTGASSTNAASSPTSSSAAAAAAAAAAPSVLPVPDAPSPAALAAALRHGDSLYALLVQVLKAPEAFAQNSALGPLLRNASLKAIQRACASAPDVDRPLLTKAVLVAWRSSQLSILAGELTPSEVLQSASAALACSQAGAAHVLLKHLAAQHGLKDAALVPHFALFINDVAAHLLPVMGPAAADRLPSPPSSVAAAASGGSTAPLLLPPGSNTSASSASDALPGPKPVLTPALSTPASSSSISSSSSSVPPSAASSISASAATASARAKHILDHLPHLEPFLVGFLVRLSRDGHDVDLSKALTATAKRLAIRMCASQGRTMTALKLWASWQQRHSPADIGRAAAGWLMVACADQRDWQVGKQLLRYLDPTLLELDFQEPRSPAALPSTTSGTSASPEAMIVTEHQQRRDPITQWALLGDRLLAAYLRVLAALLLPDTEASSNHRKAVASQSSSSSPHAISQTVEPLPVTVDVTAAEAMANNSGRVAGTSAEVTAAAPTPSRRGRPPSSSKAAAGAAKRAPSTGTAEEPAASPAPQQAPASVTAPAAPVSGSTPNSEAPQGLSAGTIAMLDAVIRGETKLDVANLAGGPMLLDVLQFMVGVLKRIRPGPPAESAPASTSAPPPAPQLSQHDYNAVRLVTTLLHQMQQVQQLDQDWRRHAKSEIKKTYSVVQAELARIAGPYTSSTTSPATPNTEVIAPAASGRPPNAAAAVAAAIPSVQAAIRELGSVSLSGKSGSKKKSGSSESGGARTKPQGFGSGPKPSKGRGSGAKGKRGPKGGRRGAATEVAGQPGGEDSGDDGQSKATSDNQGGGASNGTPNPHTVSAHSK